MVMRETISIDHIIHHSLSITHHISRLHLIVETTLINVTRFGHHLSNFMLAMSKKNTLEKISVTLNTYSPLRGHVVTEPPTYCWNF